VTLHPAALDGTNPAVFGTAWMSDAAGDCAPSANESAFVHVMTVVSVGPSTRNVAESGMLKHAEGPVMTPRSSDQSPPGVFG
jgi:hypothetical protein